MKLTFEPERILILKLLSYSKVLLSYVVCLVCVWPNQIGEPRHHESLRIFLLDRISSLHIMQDYQEMIYWLWQELRYAMSILLILMTYLDLSMSRLGFYYVKWFFITEREDFYPLGTLSRTEITTNVSVTKLEVFVCFFPVQFAFFYNLLKVCLLFLDPFLSRRIWYFYNNNREHLSPLCKHIWASW